MNTDVFNATTFLFVPGDRPDRFEKAISSGADQVVIDLEDAVTEAEKDAARSEIVGWLSGGGRAAVRINGVGTTHHHADIEAIRDLEGITAVVLAMAQDPAEVAEVVAQLGAVPLVALIETAVGVSRAAKIAKVPGVARLAFGNLDYAADIAADPESSVMLPARSALVIASRVGSLTGPIDGVTTTLGDAETAAQDARLSRDMGFTGKFCIHPSQVDVVRSAFAPTENQVRWANSVVRAAADGGLTQVEGQFVDRPVIARAEAILLRAGERSA